MIKKATLRIALFFLWLISKLPFSVLYLFSSLFYLILYYLIRYRKKVVNSNLTNSFPDKNNKEIIKIEKDFYRHFTDLVVEIIKLSSISEKELLKRVKFTNINEATNYLANGQSILMCIGHSCNWEMVSMAFGFRTKQFTSYVIYKKLNNPEFDTWFNHLRARFGIKMVEMKQTMRAVVETKNELNVFAFASDQTPHIKERVNHTLTFLNQPTAVFLGLEKVAQLTNRPVFYTDCTRTKRGYYEVTIVPLALKPKETTEYEITNRFFEYLEKTIRREPALWLWSHRRWKLNT